MKQLALSVVLVICGCLFTKAQNKTYIGLEASIFSNRTEIQDNGNWLTSTVMNDPMGGVNLRQDVGKHFFWETGVLVKPYWRGYSFKGSLVPVLSVNYFSWLIPLRTGAHVNLHEERIFLVPVVGYTLGIQPPMEERQTSGTRIYAGNTIIFSDRENPDVSRQFSLVQAGIGLEFKLFKTLLWSFNTNYYKGFNKISLIDISYSVNGSSLTTGTSISKGDFWCLGTGVKYPISKKQ